jgi:hypothetical protein
MPSCRKSCDFCTNPEKLEKDSKQFKLLASTGNPKRRRVSIYCINRHGVQPESLYLPECLSA